MRRLVLVVVSLLCLLSRPTLLSAQGKDDFLRLEQTGCYGSCPQYSVTVYGDGRVSYFGKEFVRVKGNAYAFVLPAAAKKLFEEAKKIGFFSLDDSYDLYKSECVTDGPGQSLTLSTERRLKRIFDYCNSPKGLIDLEFHVDEVAGGIRWVFVDGPEMKKLLRHGFNLKQDGPKFVDDAVYWDQPDVIEILIKAGLDPNMLDADKNTFLSNAVRTGHYKATKVLLELGAVYTIPDHWGDTPDWYAVLRGPQMLQLFLSKGLDVNSGQGALLCGAASQGDVESIKLLLSSGASINIRDSAGKTPLDCAEPFVEEYPYDASRIKAAIAFLVRAGAVH